MVVWVEDLGLLCVKRLRRERNYSRADQHRKQHGTQVGDLFSQWKSQRKINQHQYEHTLPSPPEITDQGRRRGRVDVDWGVALARCVPMAAALRQRGVVS